MSREYACSVPAEGRLRGGFISSYFVLAQNENVIQLQQVAGDYAPQVGQYFQTAHDPTNEVNLTEWVIVKIFKRREASQVEAFVVLLGFEAVEAIFKIDLPKSQIA